MELSLERLKEIADTLKFNYHPNIGEAKLREKLEAHAIELGTTLEEVNSNMLTSTSSNSIENENSLKDEDMTSTTATIIIENKPIINTVNDEAEIEKLRNLTFADVEADQSKKAEQVVNKEAMKLIRCMITCNNKNKTSYIGEIFTARNAVLPEIKKFIPFGTITHIPQIIFNVIKEKQYQAFTKVKQPSGNTVTKSKMIPEYNIQLLDPITKEELEAIKQKQLAEGYTGE